MGRKMASSTLLVCGVLMMLFGVSQWSAPEVASAMPALQPSPRPTLVPTEPAPTAVPTEPAPTAVPTEPAPATTVPTEVVPTTVPTEVVPQPTKTRRTRNDDSKPREQPPAAGRITGTIIDVNTGAPMPGVTVSIDGLLVTSDANGNYDHWMAPGAYNVALQLSPQQGTPAQDAQVVELESDTTVVLHLSMRGVLPTATSAPAPEPSPVPAQEPSAVPAEEPAGGAAISQQRTPNRLPRTAAEANSAWLWMALGLGLIAAGGVVGVKAAAKGSRPRPLRARARGASADHDALLSKLLADVPCSRAVNPGRAAKKADDSNALLAALLSANPGARRSRDEA